MEIAYILKTEEEMRCKTNSRGWEFKKLPNPKYYIGFAYGNDGYCWYKNSGGLDYCNSDLINIQRILPEYSSKSYAKKKLIEKINNLNIYEEFVEIRYIDLDSGKVDVIDKISTL